jgi:transcription termination factor Rho
MTVYLHPSVQNSTCPFVIGIKDVMGNAPETSCDLRKFKDLLPYYPTERLFLETNEGVSWSNQSMRIVDLLSPIGLGQRGLIVASPRTGIIVLLQGIANAISMNRPDINLIILLVDERPEEVTDFRRQVPSAETISSTFDESADNHVHAAAIVIDKAGTTVEAGQHVVILLDSITRPVRAHNAVQPSSGKLLSGGIDANALRAPKRFFGSARNIEGGGSLTILATALVDTGSKMDEVTCEEFKGTENMELHLGRSLVEKVCSLR